MESSFQKHQGSGGMKKPDSPPFARFPSTQSDKHNTLSMLSLRPRILGGLLTGYTLLNAATALGQTPASDPGRTPVSPAAVSTAPESASGLAEEFSFTASMEPA